MRGTFPHLAVILIAAIACAAGCGSPEKVEPAAEPRSAAFLDDLPPGLRQVMSPWTGDLEAMAERRVVRLLTVFGPMAYFLDGPEQRGIVYETAAAFEKELNRNLKSGALPVRVMIVPLPRDRLLPALVAGRGDIVAANLTITPERLESVDFSEPMLREVSEIVVTGPSAPRLDDLDDLAGHELSLRRASSYWESVERLNESFIARGLDPVRLVEVDGYHEDEDLLELVQAGVLPMAVIDSHKAGFWKQFFDRVTLRPDLVLRSGGEIAWAIRKDSPKLRQAIDDFVRKHRKGTLFGNVVYKRYLEDTRWIGNPLDDDGSSRLGEMADLFRKYGEMYDLDWLLLAAQGYQESGLKPGKRSRSGAIGVMQVRPSTAKQVGIRDIGTLENNIHAGAKYLRYVMDEYLDEEDLDRTQRHLLGLAAYNAGPSRMRKLRAEAERNGLDPNVWFDNVEVVTARRVGSETVRYVSNITKYYVAYKAIAEGIAARENE